MRFSLLTLLLVASIGRAQQLSSDGQTLIYEGKTYSLCPDGIFREKSAAMPLRSVADAPKAKAQIDDGFDALWEVNAKRAARGMRPYLNDAGLNQGALACATYRAARLMFGHCDGQMGDFAFLPPGVHAEAGGCAAYEPSYGFMACAMFDNYTYCGAAWVLGRDGKRYCHLFVR